MDLLGPEQMARPVLAVEKYVSEARPPGIAMCSAMTKSELAESSDDESSDETGLSWSGASGTSSIAATAAVVKSVGDDWPPGIAKCSATQNVGVPVPQDVKEFLEVVRPPPRGPLAPLEEAELRRCTAVRKPRDGVARGSFVVTSNLSWGLMRCQKEKEKKERDG